LPMIAIGLAVAFRALLRPGLGSAKSKPA